MKNRIIMSMNFENWRTILAGKPFDLDSEGINWVFKTISQMTTEEKVGQTFLPLVRDLSTEAMEQLLRMQVGGIHRMPSRPRDILRANAEYLNGKSSVPLLFSADLEFSEKGSFVDGTRLTNQMGVAATGDMKAIERMAEIAAIEGRWCGFNWTFTPVVDIDFNFRSSVVNTRSFGSTPPAVASAAERYIHSIQRHGMAACAKHWPGDGLDERDQHYVTTVNSLHADEWRATFGKVYRQVVDAGVKTIMAGHIALPAFQSSPGRAASLDPDLLKLLRQEIGFRGLIVSDAAPMVGFLSQGKRADLMPACIQAGCDILLFPDRLEDDFHSVMKGLDRGILTISRLDEAVLRILALKASLGLHSSTQLTDFSTVSLLEHQSWAKEIADQSVTLVRDEQQLLPMTLEKYPRILILEVENRLSPSGVLPPLQVAELFRKRGYEVTIHKSGADIDFKQYDIALYLVAEEGLSGKLHRLQPDWGALHGPFPSSLYRLWQDIPAVMVSFGSPYHLYDAPECPTLVNAYSAVDDVQNAVVRALTREIDFRGQSPVDPFAGLSQGRN
ncbi:Beta-glucosidase-like glycosyl hydrolase [Agrobacterium deltaense NCPPB 1641]|uniref:beta-N-acetylhexosaminidase n=2 Tax=Rhizobium/Agrobacterium group TaxID=227290 RepID=A0A1S7UAE3_9HYPH|nr:Beta-glucosidase-like glycosyl hydrolase [Agrobacterium deltaense NCPPB 1641]